MIDGIVNLQETLKKIDSDLCYSKLCEMSNEQKQEYERLLNLFLKYNSIKDDGSYKRNELNRLKGTSLEDLATYLLKVSGNLFEVRRNLRTSTNEIDQLFQPTTVGKVLIGLKVIDEKYELFLGECKNYNKNVDVTYVGKFCSLMLTNQVKLGLLFSYHGLSGSGWSNASGVVKKFYLHKEKLEERYCIIDINKDDFIAINNGGNLLQIVSDKLLALQVDTDYKKHLSKHPAES